MLMFDVSSLCRNFSQLSLTHRRTGSEHELETRDFYFHVEYCRYQYVLGVGTDTVLYSGTGSMLYCMTILYECINGIPWDDESCLLWKTHAKLGREEEALGETRGK